MRIDVHAHYFPTTYLDTLDSLGSRATFYARNMNAGEREAEMATRLQLMDAAGVDLQVLSAAPQLPYFEDEADSLAAARLANDLYAELIAAHPTRFAAFAAVPLPHVDASLDEAARAMDQLGMVGVTVATSVMGRPLTDPAFRPLWEELDRRGAALYVHPAGAGCCSHLVNDPHLTWPVGAPMEDTVAVVAMIQDGIPARYPNMKIVASHLGGALPMLVQRLDNQAPWFMPEGAEAPSAGARRLWYDTVAHGHVPALQCAAAAFGAERLLLGSDFPYVQGEHYARGVEFIGEAGFDAAAVEAILGGTAQRLLGLAA